MVGLFTTRPLIFQWRAKGYDWSLVDSIGQPSVVKNTNKESEMVWYFFGVYIINRTLQGRLEIRNFSSRVEKIFFDT